MTTINITVVLNGRFVCTRCRDSHDWIRTRRPAVRQNSTIYSLRCGHCGEQIVAKVIGGTYSGEAARRHARGEYASLCELQLKFPQDDRYGTLVPLGHLEYAGHGILITRFTRGDDLGHYLRTLDAAGVTAVCRASGVWLKKLHESDVQNQQKYLGTADKISFMIDTYGTVLRHDPKIIAACEVLGRESSKIDAVAVIAVRQHGDFKPDNMLYDGTRLVGLDIPWQYTGAAVYDVAPFLNHLWLENRFATSSRRLRLHDLAESAFLSGYGDIGEMHALRWVQLYFALCYIGVCRKRGGLAASYASWKGWPLVRRLAAQLETGG